MNSSIVALLAGSRRRSGGGGGGGGGADLLSWLLNDAATGNIAALVGPAGTTTGAQDGSDLTLTSGQTAASVTSVVYGSTQITIKFRMRCADFGADGTRRQVFNTANAIEGASTVSVNFYFGALQVHLFGASLTQLWKEFPAPSTGAFHDYVLIVNSATGGPGAYGSVTLTIDGSPISASATYQNDKNTNSNFATGVTTLGVVGGETGLAMDIKNVEIWSGSHP